MAFEDDMTDPEGEPEERNVRRLKSVFASINDNLARIGAPLLNPAIHNTRAAIKARLRQIAIVVIKQEIQNDPEARGYAGKTDVEIRDLLNEPYLKVTQIPDGQGGFVNLTTQESPRICKILRGFPLIPNRVRTAHIAEIMA